MQQMREEWALDRLGALVGEWEMEATVDGSPMGTARTKFEWTDDGAFMVQHTDELPSEIEVPPEWRSGSPLPVVTLFGLDDHTDEFSMLYSDARGVRRVYRMTLDDRGWRVWGQPGPQFHQRFIATFDDDGDTIAGRWEGSRDGMTWEPDFDVTYRRVR